MSGREAASHRQQEDVDALEDEVLGDAPAESAADADREDDPAFELDLDPDEQGTAAAAAANPD